MKLLILSAVLFLTSCSTGLLLWAQEECYDDNRSRTEGNQRSCGDISDVVDAVAHDASAAKAIGSSLQSAVLVKPDEAPLHEGEDSGLCSPPSSKVCSANQGCECVD